ncbi:MAG: hypothetical protein HY247_00680 [archaeon]|nr:MAG: hypothetical protein HY247_00680 [archaeon]
MGYSLERIGMKIALPLGEPLVPDLSFKNANPNELLLIEAKSGGVDSEQGKKYSKLQPLDISKKGLTSLDAKDLSIQVCYACTASNKQKVLENEKRNKLGFPIIAFENNRIVKEPSSALFKNHKLEKFFSAGVSFERSPSTDVYPFSADDSRGWIAFYVMAKLVELHAVGKTRFSEKDLMLKCHPLISYFSNEHQGEVHSVVHKALVSIVEIGSTRVQIRSVGNQEWEITKFHRVKSVRKMLMDLAEKLDSEPQDLRRFLTEAASLEEQEAAETLD